MARNEHDVLIACSTETAFGFVTDLQTWSQWHGSGQVENTTLGSIGVGTIWRVTGRVQGRTIVVTIEVTDYEPNSYFGFEFNTDSGFLQGRQTFTFQAVQGGTQLTTVLELADPELAPPARQQWENDLRTLKELLETGS